MPRKKIPKIFAINIAQQKKYCKYMCKFLHKYSLKIPQKILQIFEEIYRKRKINRKKSVRTYGSLHIHLCNTPIGPLSPNIVCTMQAPVNLPKAPVQCTTSYRCPSYKHPSLQLIHANWWFLYSCTHESTGLIWSIYSHGGNDMSCFAFLGVQTQIQMLCFATKHLREEWCQI